jgi:hypothetical protein
LIFTKLCYKKQNSIILELYYMEYFYTYIKTSQFFEICTQAPAFFRDNVIVVTTILRKNVFAIKWAKFKRKNFSEIHRKLGFHYWNIHWCISWIIWCWLSSLTTINARSPMRSKCTSVYRCKNNASSEFSFSLQNWKQTPPQCMISVHIS